MRVNFYTLHVPLKYSFLNVDRDLNGPLSQELFRGWGCTIVEPRGIFTSFICIT